MKFSDLLGDAIKHSGMSENKFASAADINRGDIWRILNGQLLPKENKFENMIEVLKLDPYAERFLAEAYWSEILGPEMYSRIGDVLRLLNGFRDTLSVPKPAAVKAFGGSAAEIPGAVREFIRRTDGEIIASFPVEDIAVTGALLSCMEDFPQKTVKLMVSFSQQGGGREPVSNLFRLFSAVRCIRAGIMPVYRYDEKSGVFPYCICGKNRALLFGDVGFAVITEPAAAEVLFKSLTADYQACRPLGAITENVFDVKEVFAPVQHATHEAELCGYPYVSNYLDFEILASSDRVQPCREGLVRYAAEWYSGVETSLKIVSYEGVERFARIGFYKEITPEYVRPFPPEQREKILKRMLTDAAEGRLCIADQHKFAHPEGVDISIAGGCICLELFRYSEEYGYDVYYAHLNLHDSAAAELLKDAISFMPKLGLCLSRDAAEKHISACLGSLSGRFT